MCWYSPRLVHCTWESMCRKKRVAEEMWREQNNNSLGFERAKRGQHHACAHATTAVSSLVAPVTIHQGVFSGLGFFSSYSSSNRGKVPHKEFFDDFTGFILKFMTRRPRQLSLKNAKITELNVFIHWTVATCIPLGYFGGTERHVSLNSRKLDIESFL